MNTCRSHKTLLPLLFSAVLVLMGWMNRSSAVVLLGPAETMEAAMTMVGVDVKAGLSFRLSEGGEGDAGVVTAQPAPAAKLDEAATGRVLARLPALKPERSDERAFARREDSLPPPRTGKTVLKSFPPPEEGPAAVKAVEGPLVVSRFAPEGEVPLAPHLSVTFSQPMVSLTSLDDQAEQARPVRLTPEPPGQWRWIGTSTLLFEPRGRFPMATEYHVEVPKGVKSAVGTRLETPVRWTFSTPPPRLTGKHPETGPTRVDPLIFMSFEQKIDPEAVLANVQVRAGGTTIPVSLATIEDIAADPAVKRLVDSAVDATWLALRPKRPLPSSKLVTVTAGSGTPSAEGPRKTAAAQTFEFRTYGPLKVVEPHCGRLRGEKCPPLTPWYITFSNPLDARAFSSDMVNVTPALPGLKTSVSGSNLTIRGQTMGRTAYKVTLKAALPDQFGQTLGRDETITFKVTEAPAMLTAQGGPFVVLDPAAGPRFPVYSVNHKSLKVDLYAVTPREWSSFGDYLSRSARNEETPSPPGKKMFSRTVPVEGRPDELTETLIDLSAALHEGFGQVVAVIEPTVQQRPRQIVQVWIQVTQIGLDAFADATDLVGWATSLKDGRPLDGVELMLLPSGGKARTGADGLAGLKLSQEAGALLVARRNADTAILPEQTSPYSWYGRQGWVRSAPADTIRWFVFDDRKMYRPGEEVKIKGWVRRHGTGKGGDIGALGGKGSIEYILKDSRGNELSKGSRPLGAMEGFDFSLKLPGTMNLGAASVQLAASAPDIPAARHYHSFKVQEFRRPEFEVSTKASEGPHLVGGAADVTVTASYYAGGGLANADVTWRVTSSEGSFVPPNRSDFHFGTWTPWWGFHPPHPAQQRSENFSGQTDSMGRHRLRVAFESISPSRPSNVNIEATVMDVNRQAWVASTSLLVHPSSLYVGIRSTRPFVQQNEPIHIDAIATDFDGKSMPGQPVKISASRMERVQEAGEWKEKPFDVQDCSVTSGHDPVRCTFRPREGGSYRITAVVSDEQSRTNESEMRVWVAGGKAIPSRKVEQEKVVLIPDRKEYKAGDTAEVLVVAPFSDASGVLTLRRSGTVRTEYFLITGTSHTLKIPIEEAYTRNIHVQVDLNGQAPRMNSAGEPASGLPPRPSYATGSVNLRVPPLQRTLALRVAPRETELEPGGETMIDIDLHDAHGAPAPGGEVAVVVVDEAILSLTGYRVPNPLDLFYEPRSSGVRDHHLRAAVLLSNPDELAVESDDTRGVMHKAGRAHPMAAAPPRAMESEAAQATAAGGRGDGAEPIRMRTDFSALAVFAPAVSTDARGHAQVPVKLPDSLTRYRVMAVAAAGSRRFGSSEATITARLPLMVRPSPPRFLNFGDKFELPVVIQNQTADRLEVDVAVRAANAALTDGMGRRVSVPAHDRVEVRFPAEAAKAGTARFQAGATAGRWADASEFSLPVWTPATTEAFATYGQIDEGAFAQPVSAPSDVVKEFGGIEITTSSTALQALTDAVLYLVSYPFECAEQLASRVMGIAALRDVLSAFQAEGLPSPDELLAAVDRDLKRLQMLQNSDGGFAFWRRGDESWPYISIHAAHALTRAKEKGFPVPSGMIERARGYLKDVERRFPSWYGRDARMVLTSYALYVRARMGDPDPARARALIREAGVEKVPLEAVGWLLPVLSPDKASSAETAAIQRLLANRATETAGAAHFVASYEDGAHLLLHSNRRTDGIILDALIGDQPRNDLIPKLVAGLLAHRKAGRWTNTQENVFILMALDRYFNTYEKVEPDFIARAWLGDVYAGGHAFKGRTTERHHTEIPMSYLVSQPKNTDLTLAKEGPGRLYYRIGMRYAPSNLVLPPADRGFTVERAYLPIDDANDVRRDEEGVWRIRAGARVQVRLSLVAPARRYHVALVDPIPAGLEPLNPALAVTGSIPQGPSADVTVEGAPGLGGPGIYGKWWRWTRPWFEHQNLRDERAEAFSSLLWEGVYTYTYTARATTPGRFVVPPPKAEEMYSPETFGRGRGDRVVVE